MTPAVFATWKYTPVGAPDPSFDIVAALPRLISPPRLDLTSLSSTLSPMSNPYFPSSPASSSNPASPLASGTQPITRSRTLFYLSIRDSSVTSYSRRGPKRAHAQYGDTVDVADDESEGLMGGRGGSGGVDMRGLPPKWWSECLDGERCS